MEARPDAPSRLLPARPGPGAPGRPAEMLAAAGAAGR